MGSVARSQEKRYEIWVTLEEWDGNDDRIDDRESLLVGTVKNLTDGKTVFDAVQKMAIAVLDVVPVKDIE